MKHNALRAFACSSAVVVAGSIFVACGGSGGGGTGGVFAPFLGNASRADLSGQSSAYTGKLDSGVTITFPAVRGVDYLIQVETSSSSDEVTFDVFSESGAHRRSKSVDPPDGFIYRHEERNEHVLVLCRPRNPLDDGIRITRLTVTGVGSFPNDRVNVNLIVAGAFNGYGAFNDLKTSADQTAFTTAVMTRVRSIFQPLGITVSHESFAYTADDIRNRAPQLLGADDAAICAAGESMNSQGFDSINLTDLDQYGALGFPATDPVYTRGHAIDAYIIHHFTTDGTAGLSPRPGQIVGNGPDTACAAGAFVQFGNGTQLQARTPDQVGLVLAHELGHFLGLLHTSSFDPGNIAPTRAIDDGLSDTPACTILTDVNGDGFVGIGDGCQDEANVMFYQAGAQTTLTTGQGNVMKTMLSVQEH